MCVCIYVYVCLICIYWGGRSWDIPPLDKGGLLYTIISNKNLIDKKQLPPDHHVPNIGKPNMFFKTVFRSFQIGQQFAI